MNYKEQQERVFRLFERRLSDIDVTVTSVKSMTSVKEQRDQIARAVTKILPMELAYYNESGVGYEKYHIFNGKYYERIPVDGIKYGLDEFLYRAGLPAAVRDDKSLHHYMLRVLDNIKMHVLKPRLSLMCFENCVVDMNDLKPMEHSWEHDVVKMYPFRYDRKEIFNCKLWNKFIGESYIPGLDNDGVLPEKEKRHVLQMFLGACLADRMANTFEYFAILQGTGANGKSVIQRVLTGMFGEEEMINIKLSHFSRGGDEGMRAVGALSGKRLIHCTESTKSDFRDMSTIKAISSGEPLVGRSIGENIKMMMRPPLLICNSNYRWKLEDFTNKEDPDDDSVSRRAIIINFEKTIPADKRDAHLATKLLEESAGIFAWIVKGLVDLRKNDYRLPSISKGGIDTARSKCSMPVLAANGQYVHGTISTWLKLITAHQKPLVGKDTYMIKRLATDLYDCYERFCKANGLEVAAPRKFSLDMNNLEYGKVRNGGSLYTMYIEDEHTAVNIDTVTPLLTKDMGVAYNAEETSNEEFVDDEGA